MNTHEGGHAGRPQHKTLQLCAQIERALTFALADAEDEVLCDLAVVSVEPTADASELLVTVDDPYGHGLPAVLPALERARGHLRAAIASAITRRRVPQLCFRLEPPDRAD